MPRRINHLVGSEITLNIEPGDVQTTWDDPSGVINDFSLVPIRAGFPGEITYIGTSLHDETLRTSTEDADYSFALKVMGTRNLRIDLRIRRQDASNFIALRIDFPTNTLKLVETVGGVETILSQSDRTLEFQGVHAYEFGTQSIGTSILGFQDGFNAVQGSTANFRTEPGFSLNFPTIDGADLPAIVDISAGETVLENSPSLPDDLSDLYLQFRLQIKEEIENPATFTWATYQKALKLYEQRNVGAPDETWEFLGYPIRKPASEEWFGSG